jgi:hypothetical protein
MERRETPSLTERRFKYSNPRFLAFATQGKFILPRFSTFLLGEFTK